MIYEVENYSLGGRVVETFIDEEEAVRFAEKMSRKTGYTYLVNPKE